METTSDLNFKRVLLLLRKRKTLFFLTAGIAMAVMTAGSYLLPKIYEARTVIFIERNLLNEMIKNVTVTSSGEDKARALAVIMKSRSLILRVMTDLDINVSGMTADQTEAMIRSFQEKTEIKTELSRSNQKDLDVFTVSFTHNDPLLASNFVNSLVKRYVEQNLSLKREESMGASRFLVDQIASFKAKLEKVESAIARQRREKSIPDKEMPLYDLLQALLKKRSELLAQYTENHPEVIRLKTEIEMVRAQIKETSIEPKFDTTLIDLERERETTKKIYEDLLATLRRSEVSTQLQLQDKSGAFRVIDPAIAPTSAKSPNMTNMVLLSILGGLGAGIALLIVLDKNDETVKSVDLVKRIGLPVLAVISTIQSEKEAAAARRKDRLIYAAAALYLAFFLAIAAVEAAGLLSVGNFIKDTRVEISNTVKQVRQEPAPGGQKGRGNGASGGGAGASARSGQ